VNLHKDIPRKANIIFTSQPSDLRGGGSNPPWPPRLPRYFRLPMVNPSKPPLPPNRPYCRPLNYPKYVNDYNPYVHVKVFKATIKANSETNDREIVNLFKFTFKHIVCDWCNSYMGDYLDCTFVEL
jgi:hypothetical protein